MLSELYLSVKFSNDKRLLKHLLRISWLQRTTMLTTFPMSPKHPETRGRKVLKVYQREIHTYGKYSHPKWKFHVGLVTVCLPKDVCVEAALLIIEGVQLLVIGQVQLAGVGAGLIDGGARGHVNHRAVHYLTHTVLLAICKQNCIHCDAVIELKKF